MHIYRTTQVQQLFTVAAWGAVLSGILTLHNLQAQVITRIAVLDYSKVLRTYSNQSREFQQIKNLNQELQEKMEKLKQQLAELQEQLNQAQAAADNAQARSIQNKISRQRNYGRKYLESTKQKIKTLRELANDPTRSNNAQKFLPDIISQVAREQGYSIVLDKSHQGIIWLDISIDITQTVSQRLQKRLEEIS